VRLEGVLEMRMVFLGARYPGECQGMVGVEIKPAILGDDRGYRVVVVGVISMLNLNPHPPGFRRVRHPAT